MDPAPEDRSTLGSILIFLAMCTGLLFGFVPYFTMVNPRIPDQRTYQTLQNLRVADDYFRMEYEDDFDFEWYPTYRTNWVAELTAGEGAVLNTRRTQFANANLIDGQPVDHWQQPILAISITNQQGYLALSFYSVGADGISRSQGNDPDDVNSWNESKPWQKLYAAERDTARSIRITPGLTLWCFVLFAGFYFRCRSWVTRSDR